MKQMRSGEALAAIQSPFQRLRDLLGEEKPGAAPIDMTIGEPRHGMPTFATEIVARHAKEFEKYPPIGGIPDLRAAIADWLTRRNVLGGDAAIDADRHVLPLCGTREGLVSALVVAKARAGKNSPAVLMPNPFYQAYYAAAVAAECEPVLLPATRETHFLPDLDTLDPGILDRAAAFYLASPANPQGIAASATYLERLIDLARRHGFYVFLDECYSEIYRGEPPASGIAVAAQTGGFDNVLVFNSLSKRSNAPGMRSGFIAGDPAFLRDFLKFRNVACPQVPLPIQHASAALWRDEGHVVESRALYLAKFDLAETFLGNLPGFYLPDGGFFLWLNLSHLNGGEQAAKTIWKGCGVKMLPGAYLAQPDASGCNPAKEYARLALVDPLEVTREALDRLASAIL